MAAPVDRSLSEGRRRSSLRRLLIGYFRAVALVAAFVFPAVASACPACAGRTDASPWRSVILGVFIFVPYAVVYAVVRYMRAQAREAEGAFPRDADDVLSRSGDVTSSNDGAAGRASAAATQKR